MKLASHIALVVLAALAAPRREARAFASESPIRPESRVWITGASNIRRFTCRAKTIAGAIDLRGATTSGPSLTGANVSRNASLSVTVDRIDCGIGIMSRHLHETLRGDRHPVIEFRLATYEVDLNAAAPTAGITGVVTIAGIQRPVTATAAVRSDTLGRLHVVGTYTARPSDFGVRPPRRFGGLLRVRDRIVVHFDVALDADGGTIDDIACSLLSTRAPNHAPHS